MQPSQEGKPHNERGSRGLRETVVAVVGLAIVALVFYSPILIGIWTFPDGDFTHHFFPFSQHMADAWRSLTPPLWNPYTYAGHPFWADIQAAVLYPISNLLVLLTLPLASDSVRFYVLQVEAVLHVFLAGWFVYLLASELTGRTWPAILGGVTFMISGYLTGYPALQLAVLRTAIWLPLTMWLLLRAWREPRRWRYWTGAAISIAVAFLAGHTQTWMFMAYALAGWIIALTFGLGGSAPSDGNRAAFARPIGLAASAAVAAGLVAAQLLPSLEFARLSVRADVGFAYVSGGFPLRDTWQMLLPGVLTHFSPLYVGVVGLGMAAFGAVFGASAGITDGVLVQDGERRCRRVATAYFAALALIGLLVSYGDNGFLYPILYRVAPGWDMFRGQERAAYVVAFGLSMLAALGLAAVPMSSRQARRRFALLYGASVTAGVYLFGLLWQLPGQTAIGPWRFLALAALTLVMAMSLAVTIWLDGWSVRREWLICGLAAANLFVVNVGTNLVLRTPAAAVTLAPEVIAVQRAVAETPGVTGLPGRTYNEFRVFEDYGMQAGVEDVWGSSPLRLSAYAILFDQFPLDRMFQLTGVAHVLTWRREMFEPSTLVAEYPAGEDVTYLHRLDEANPRMWTVGGAAQATDGVARALLADHTFDLTSTVLLPPETPLREWSVRSDATEVQADRLKPHQLDVEVTGGDGSILVVSENWMPGWRVEGAVCADEQACRPGTAHDSGLPLLSPVRANLAFLAIALPESDVRFQLVYAPDSVRTGVSISGATLVLLFAAILVRFVVVRKRRTPGP